MTDPTVWDLLAAPFDDDQVEQVPTGRGGGTAPYVKVQAVEDRLDAVLGPDGWECSFRTLASEGTLAAVECTLTLRVGDRETSKADAGEANFEEPFKAAYSDALKRAARRFGVARYLGMPERGQQRQPEPRNASVQNPEPGKPSFLADVKEAWGYDPDQVVDILGVPLDRAKTLNREQQSRAWAKIKKTHEESGVPF